MQISPNFKVTYHACVEGQKYQNYQKTFVLVGTDGVFSFNISFFKLSLLISIGKLKPTIGMITYRNTCALDSKGKIAYKLI